MNIKLKNAGFGVTFDPVGDGDCFFWAVAFQLGTKQAAVKDAFFEYLARNQFDVSILKKDFSLVLSSYNHST